MKKLFALFSIVLFAASLSAQVVNSSKLFSSRTGNYSVEVPENWKTRIEFSNQYSEHDYVMVEKSSYVSPERAIIYIDQWVNLKEYPLSQWINRMHEQEIFTFTAEKCKPVNVGLSNLPGLKYSWIEPTDNRRQAWDMDVVFAAVGNRVFRFTYHKADEGIGQAEFQKIVHRFSEASSERAIDLIQREEGDLEIFPVGVSAKTGVQTCNGNTTCGTNPYGCCSYGNCVWWAWRHAACSWGVALNVWGNASNWYGNAKAEGYIWTNTTTNSNAGAIACWQGQNHVGVLSSVSNGAATLRQMSCEATPVTQPYNQAFTSAATASFGYFAQKPRLASNITINPNPFRRDVGTNSAQVAITVPGPIGFYGKIAAAFHTTGGSFVKDLQVYNTAAQNVGTSTWTFSTSGTNLPPAGTYRLQIKYQVNGTGNWFLFGGNNNIIVDVVNSSGCALPPAQGGGWPSTAINLNGSDGYAQSSGLRRYDSRHNVRLGWHNGWCGNSNVSGDTWFKFRIPSTGTFTFQTEAGDVSCTTNMGQAIVRMFWTNNGNSNGSDLNYFYCASPIANNSGRQMPHIWFQAQGHGLAGKWVYVQVVGYANHQGVFRAALNKLSNTGLVADNSDNPEAMAAYAYDIDMPDALPPTLIPLTVQAKVEDAVTESTLRVFPNPARDFFNVEVNYSGMEKDGQATIMIKNLNGQILQRRTVGVSQGNNLFEMDSSNLPNGIYLASMALPDGTMLHYKVLVQK